MGKAVKLDHTTSEVWKGTLPMMESYVSWAVGKAFFFCILSIVYGR